ncbi:MAG TPA: GNAT family N-acetyltransferase [Candidatus Acidoferrales bacterium]|nr:GNAT family N-acetyltransferase [Candidatus Acidoferrales bacterium]
MITYREGNDLDLQNMIELYEASTLGERRPVSERERMAAMLRHANIVITAWDGDLLVGISRALSDFSFVTYLSDLAVRVSHQRSGIGKELIRRTQVAGGPQAKIILLAAPAAAEYYGRIGFKHQSRAWLLDEGQTVR